MFLTIVYRLPGLPGAVHTALLALLWAVAHLVRGWHYGEYVFSVEVQP